MRIQLYGGNFLDEARRNRENLCHLGRAISFTRSSVYAGYFMRQYGANVLDGILDPSSSWKRTRICIIAMERPGNAADEKRRIVTETRDAFCLTPYECLVCIQKLFKQCRHYKARTFLEGYRISLFSEHRVHTLRGEQSLRRPPFSGSTIFLSFSP